MASSTRHVDHDDRGRAAARRQARDALRLRQPRAAAQRATTRASRRASSTATQIDAMASATRPPGGPQPVLRFRSIATSVSSQADGDLLLPRPSRCGEVVALGSLEAGGRRSCWERRCRRSQVVGPAAPVARRRPVRPPPRTPDAGGRAAARGRRPLRLRHRPRAGQGRRAADPAVRADARSRARPATPDPATADLAALTLAALGGRADGARRRRACSGSCSSPCSTTDSRPRRSPPGSPPRPVPASHDCLVGRVRRDGRPAPRRRPGGRPRPARRRRRPRRARGPVAARARRGARASATSSTPTATRGPTSSSTPCGGGAARPGCGAASRASPRSSPSARARCPTSTSRAPRCSTRCGLPAESGEVVFQVARSVGVAAHVVEEYAEEPLRWRGRDPQG